jgi:hypothetical protein
MSRTKSRRTLLVANEVPSRAAVEELTDGSGVLVVAPALNTRLKHWLSEEDDARRRAADRLAGSRATSWRGRGSVSPIRSGTSRSSQGRAGKDANRHHRQGDREGAHDHK